MAKKKAKLDMGEEKQLSIFDMLEDIEEKKRQGPEAGSLNMGSRVKECLSLALKSVAFKRWEIAGRMSDYMGIEVTESMLNAWSADSKEGHRFPLEYLAAFCWATGDYSLIELVAHGCGCHLTKGREVVLLKMAQLDDMERKIQREKAQMLTYMEKMEREFSMG